VIKNARAKQSVALSAVMAMTGWLLIVENGRIETSASSGPNQLVPMTQALSLQPPEPNPLDLGERVRAHVSQDGWAYFAIKAPAHANALDIRLTPLHGDADLYVREAAVPQGTVASGGQFDASSATLGNFSEQISLSDAADRHWVIAVHGYRASEFDLEADIR